MTMEETGGIPVNIGDMPIAAVDMEESGIYETRLKALQFGKNLLSQKGVAFCQAQFEVVSGDYEGYTVFLNYLPIPVPIPAEGDLITLVDGSQRSATKGDRIRAINNNIAFAKMAQVFGVDKSMPALDPRSIESRDAWLAWAQEQVDRGLVGKISIKNQEFPTGSGRRTPNVNDFVF